MEMRGKGETREMGSIRQFDNRHEHSTLWQFIKFNLVSLTITAVQLALANVLPLLFDGLTEALPVFLRPVFNPETLFEGPSRYVVDGAVTWGYVLPFFLSNFLANIYGYFMNMRATFRGRGTKAGLAAYLVILTALILFSTWLQGYVTAKLMETPLASLARTIAAMAAGLVQMLVLFPLEKFVLFRKKALKRR